jgi:deazaflavin-dependent oxidoreductase (nitroreductase family)
MWFMNKIANPFVRLILRSPLHGLMSKTLLLITYRGRKSGKAYTLPVEYTQSGNEIFIVPGTPDRKTWWRNLRGGAPVDIVLRGQRSHGKATALNSGTDCEAVARALGLYLQRLPAAASMHGLQPRTDGGFDPEELHKAALFTVMVRVELDR